MKKRLLILVLILSLFTTKAYGKEDLVIDSWIVKAHLQEDGSLYIEKDITYEFNKKFNGVYVDIELDKIMDIEDLRVYELVDGKELEYLQDQDAKKGQAGLYSMDLGAEAIRIMIFSPSEDEVKSFRLKYRLTNVAAAHVDTGELYFKFISEENETDIGYFRATISLPKFNRQDIKIFAHGPLNGEIYFQDEAIRLEVDDLEEETFVEARLLFPLDYIPQATRRGNNSLDDILDEERALLEEREARQARREELKSFFNLTSNILSLLGIVYFSFLYMKFRRDPAIFHNMKSIYPEQITPAELSLFMNYTTGPRAYLSTLLDLARREYILIETMESKERPRKEEKQAYLFTKLKEDLSGLEEHEKSLMEWLFKEVGDGKRASTADIEQYRKENMRRLSKFQNSWYYMVRDLLRTRDFYDPRGKKYAIITLILSIAFFTISIVGFINGSLNGVLLLMISIILFIYSISLFQRKSDLGYIQYKLWEDFKKNNTSMEPDLLNLSTDLSMIYLIAMDLPMKELDHYRESVGMEYYPVHWGYFYFLHNRKGGSVFEDSFNRSFYGSNTISSSSSFGGGGGFSAGGGGGVGGSGSGGF